MVAAGLATGGAVAAAATGAAPSSAAVAVAAAKFDPLSVTFVSLKTGWALGTSPCATGACLGLRKTTNAGTSWSARPLPAALLAAVDRKVSGNPALDECCGGGLNVRFANLLDGWIYGGVLVPSSNQGTSGPVLWSTHNGGATWVQDHLPAGLSPTGSIFDLEVAGSRVYLMAPDKTDGVTVEGSPLAHDSWAHANSVALGSPAGGGQQSGSFVLQGTHGWLVEGNDRGTTGSAELAGASGWAGCRRVLRSATALPSRLPRPRRTSWRCA